MTLQEMIKKYENYKKNLERKGSSRDLVDNIDALLKDLRDAERGEPKIGGATPQKMSRLYGDYRKTYIRMLRLKDFDPSYEDSITKFYDEVIRDLKSIKKW